MKRHWFLGSYLVVMASMLASSGAAVNGAPARRSEVPAPTYMNGEVVRVDAEAGTLTLKSESGETELRVEGQARAEIAGLQAKDKVIVTYHVVDDGAGGRRSVAIQVRPASPSSGEPARPAASVSPASRPEQVAQTPDEAPVPGVENATPARLAALRESAAQDFEKMAARLATEANAIDGLWRGYQEACLTEPPATNRSRGWFHLLDGTIPEPDQDGCRQQYKEMIGRGERLRESIKLAEEAARKAEVLPGRLRQTLEKHKLDF
jgi:hypothetical protein